jgi:hypothetical protein
VSSSNGTDRPRRFDAVPFSQIRRERTEWLVPMRIPIGGVTILAGDMGLGKSQWTCLLAAELSRGELGEPSATLMLTAEDDAARTIKPRLEAAEANVELVHVVRGTSNEGFALPDDVVELDRLIAETTARLVVIDPISAHLSEQVNSWRDTDVRSALRPLADLAERHGCAIVPIMHLNKASGMPAIYRLSGSVAFSAAPRSVLFFARDPDDPDGATGRRRALSHEKCNLGPEAPTLLYEIESVLVAARGEEPAVDVSRLKLIGESTRRGNDLLDLGDTAERSELDDAQDFLRAELANGPRERSDLYKAARAEGISDKRLRKARERLGVDVSRSGFPSRSFWSLAQSCPALWDQVSNVDGGHDCANPHGSNISEGSDAASGPSRALSHREGTTGETELLEEAEALVRDGRAEWHT